MALILEGITVRDSISEKLKATIEVAIKAGKPAPTLVVIQVGDDDASTLYIGKKKAFGESIGATVVHKKFNNDVTEEIILDEIALFNNDKKIDGILVQLPLPDHINELTVLESIDPLKDADGLHSKNRALHFWPATTKGVMMLLDHYNIASEGKKVLVIGASYLVGIPTALAFLDREATVTIAHKKTADLKEECLKADIIVSAVGHPNLITREMVTKEQAVIDIGVTSVNGEIKGDADFESIKDIVKAITPVPGGTGPLTVASLFDNLVELYQRKY